VLTNLVIVTDAARRGFALVLAILRIAADHAAGMQSIPFSDSGPLRDGHMIHQHRAITDAHVWADHAVGADLYIIGELRAWIDDCCWVNSGHMLSAASWPRSSSVCLIGVNLICASAT